jgi:hypothetical protein
MIICTVTALGASRWSPSIMASAQPSGATPSSRPDWVPAGRSARV